MISYEQASLYLYLLKTSLALPTWELSAVLGSPPWSQYSSNKEGLDWQRWILDMKRLWGVKTAESIALIEIKLVLHDPRRRTGVSLALRKPLSNV